jgi:hypothetical protein
MPKVFIVQDVPKFNIANAASKWGDIVYVLPPGNMSVDMNATLRKIKQSLKHYKEGDYLLLAGDPAAMSFCAAYLARTQDLFTILRWDRMTASYTPIKLHWSEQQ